MKKLTSILSVLLLGVCLVFSGCTNNNLKMPTNVDVSNNGGSVVEVGEYYYYAKGYEQYSTLTDGKNDGDEENTALTRIKIDANKNFEYKTEVNEETFEETKTLVEPETVLGKMTGFETTNLYVVGNYIYYTTPNIHKTKDGKNRFDLTTLFKVKLDGTGNTELFTSSEAGATFRFVKIANVDYCFVKDGSNLERIVLTTGRKTTVCEDVSSIVFDNTTNSTTAYYTSAREDGLTGNVLNKIDIITGVKNVLVNEIDMTFTPLATINGTLFYVRSTTALGGTHYYNDFTNGLNSEITLHNSESVTSFKAVDKTFLNGLVVSFMFENRLEIKVLGDSTYSDTVVSSSNSCGAPKSVLYADGEYMFFTTETGIYKISYKTKNINLVSDLTDVKDTGVDFDGKYLFVFAQKESSGYIMYRINTQSQEAEKMKP